MRASLHPPAVVADRRLELNACRGELPLVLAAAGASVLDQAEAGQTGQQPGGVALTLDVNAEGDVVVAEAGVGVALEVRRLARLGGSSRYVGSQQPHFFLPLALCFGCFVALCGFAFAQPVTVTGVL